MWGIGKSDREFFNAFSRHAHTTERAAAILIEQFGDPSRSASLAGQIEQLEHDGDKIVHDTVNRLRATWITPFDRGDIQTLISCLDDVLDLIHATSERLLLFEIRTPPENALALARAILSACETIKKAVALLDNLKRAEEILKLCEELNRIENEGDELFREALGKLYKGGQEPLEVMKSREVLDDLEMALDRCEDVADAIGGVVLEYS